MEENFDSIVSSLVEKTPYYRHKYGHIADLGGLDPLSKEEVLGQEEQFLSEDCRPDQLMVTTTSGTTGAPLKHYKGRTERAAAALSLWRARRWYGVRSSRARGCRFVAYQRVAGTIEMFDRIRTEGPWLLLSLIDLSEAACEEYYSRILDHQPEWLQGVPSAIGRLADWMIAQSAEAPASLKLVELNGEQVMVRDREAIQSAFPRASVANHYGCAELWSIAYECPAGRLHVLEDNVSLEALDPAGCSASIGEAVVTSKHFLAMPLLRYKLGDRIVLGEESCSCGLRGQVIEAVEGRIGDYALTPDGRPISPVFFASLVEKVNQDYEDSIRRFRFMQSAERMACYVEVGEGWRADSEAVLRSGFAERFLGMDLAIQFGPLWSGGGRKFRAFERENVLG